MVWVAAGPVTTSSRWEPPTKKKWKRPLFTPIDIRKRTCMPGTSMRPPAPQLAAHPDCSCTGSCLVANFGEEEEQGVAAELQQARAFGIRHRQQLGEAPTDRVGQLFGPDPAPPRDVLRELREAGDVDEHHRAVDLLHRRGARIGEPLDGEAREIGSEESRIHGGPARVRGAATATRC